MLWPDVMCNEMKAPAEIKSTYLQYRKMNGSVCEPPVKLMASIVDDRWRGDAALIRRHYLAREP